jgi:hypothetical protein
MAFLRLLRTLLLGAVLTTGQAVGAPTEYEIKAVFLLHFSRFVEWPPEAFTAPDAPFVVCVFGHDPFGEALDAAVRGEMQGQHPILARRIFNVTEARECHILFLHRSEDARLAEILTTLGRNSTLTVSDSVRGVRRGEVIRLITDNDRIRLRIDVDAARAARLKIKSNLLRAAELVGSTGD